MLSYPSLGQLPQFSLFISGLSMNPMPAASRVARLPVCNGYQRGNVALIAFMRARRMGPPARPDEARAIARTYIIRFLIAVPLSSFFFYPISRSYRPILHLSLSHAYPYHAPSSTRRSDQARTQSGHESNETKARGREPSRAKSTGHNSAERRPLQRRPSQRPRSRRVKGRDHELS